jgi:hypothetical protein
MVTRPLLDIGRTGLRAGVAEELLTSAVPIALLSGLQRLTLRTWPSALAAIALLLVFAGVVKTGSGGWKLALIWGAGTLFHIRMLTMRWGLRNSA